MISGFRFLFDRRQVERLNVVAGRAVATAAAVVVVGARVFETENFRIIFAAGLAVIDRNFSQAFLDSVVDDVLHRDGRGRRGLVLIAISSSVDSPLVFLEVSLLPELVSALAALERALFVLGADLVSLESGLVREHDAAADALERVGHGRSARLGGLGTDRRSARGSKFEFAEIFRDPVAVVVVIVFVFLNVALLFFALVVVLLFLLVGELHPELDRLWARVRRAGLH